MAETKPPVITRSHATWRHGMRFDAGIGGRMQPIDADSKEAPSPVETLLNALATCTASDVIDFLEKRRTPISAMEIDVVATRRGDYPRRVMKLELTFAISGDTVEREQAERALRVSFERYCTVAGSLAGDIELTSILVLNGERGEPIQQPLFSATFPLH